MKSLSKYTFINKLDFQKQRFFFVKSIWKKKYKTSFIYLFSKKKKYIFFTKPIYIEDFKVKKFDKLGYQCSQQIYLLRNLTGLPFLKLTAQYKCYNYANVLKYVDLVSKYNFEFNFFKFKIHNFSKNNYWYFFDYFVLNLNNFNFLFFQKISKFLQNKSLLSVYFNKNINVCDQYLQKNNYIFSNYYSNIVYSFKNWSNSSQNFYDKTYLSLFYATPKQKSIDNYFLYLKIKFFYLYFCKNIELKYIQLIHLQLIQFKNFYNNKKNFLKLSIFSFYFLLQNYLIFFNNKYIYNIKLYNINFFFKKKFNIFAQYNINYFLKKKKKLKYSLNYFIKNKFLHKFTREFKFLRVFCSQKFFMYNFYKFFSKSNIFMYKKYLYFFNLNFYTIFQLLCKNLLQNLSKFVVTQKNIFKKHYKKKINLFFFCKYLKNKQNLNVLYNNFFKKIFFRYNKKFFKKFWKYSFLSKQNYTNSIRKHSKSTLIYNISTKTQNYLALYNFVFLKLKTKQIRFKKIMALSFFFSFLLNRKNWYYYYNLFLPNISLKNITTNSENISANIKLLSWFKKNKNNHKYKEILLHFNLKNKNIYCFFYEYLFFKQLLGVINYNFIYLFYNYNYNLLFNRYDNYLYFDNFIEYNNINYQYFDTQPITILNLKINRVFFYKQLLNLNLLNLNLNKWKFKFKYLNDFFFFNSKLIFNYLNINFVKNFNIFWALPFLKKNKNMQCLKNVLTLQHNGYFFNILMVFFKQIKIINHIYQYYFFLLNNVIILNNKKLKIVFHLAIILYFKYFVVLKLLNKFLKIYILSLK